MRDERVDRTLIEAALSGDEEAFASIARGSADRLFAVAHRILRDVGRAEDAVQQTLVTGPRQLPELREIVTSLVPRGAGRRIDEPAPGNCPF
jgi:DNA-directed RNA polymerase specialized sigma24 family protein